MPVRDPDENVVALFLNMAVKNELRSKMENRPIYDDREVCQLRYPGKKDTSFHLASEPSHWIQDPETGEQAQVTYAERFPRQYRQFKEHLTQTKSGTPLAQVAFLTEARRAELRALNIYTVETLAAVDGQELKNLGPGGRDLKNQAVGFLEDAKSGAPNAQMMAELEAMRARNALLEEDVKALKAREVVKEEPHDDFDDMTPEQLSEYITTHTGHAPRGAPNKRTLVRMARSLNSESAA